MTGGGAGLFLLPPLLQWAIEEYGWGVANCHLSFIGTILSIHFTINTREK